MLFVPAESFLAAALETDRGLLEYAAARQVVLATPTTLIALLRTVAHGWSHEALADQAREIHRLGRDLHGRLGRMSGHLDQVGRSLNAAVGHYNQAVGSLESRVLVAARRFADLAVTDDELPAPRPGRGTAGPSVARRAAPSARAAVGDARRELSRLGAATRRRCGVRPRAARRLVSRTRAHTLWEEGAEPGRQVVALGRRRRAHRRRARPARSCGRLSLFFDLCFVALCVGARAAGAAPRLLHRRRAAAADDARRLRAARPRPPRRDRAPRRRRWSRRWSPGWPTTAAPGRRLRALPGLPGVRHRASPITRLSSGRSNRSGSPAPRRTTSGTPSDQSTTVVGSAGVSPASTTTSTSWSSSSLISQPRVRGSLLAGQDQRAGQQRLAQSPRAALHDTAWSGIRTPTVRFFGCISRRGTSPVAGRMNV